jgi:hypothetical protein
MEQFIPVPNVVPYYFRINVSTLRHVCASYVDFSLEVSRLLV